MLTSVDKITPRNYKISSHKDYNKERSRISNEKSENRDLQRTNYSNRDFRDRISAINRTFKSSIEKHKNYEKPNHDSIKKSATSRRIETDTIQNNIKVKKRIESGKSSLSNSQIINNTNRNTSVKAKEGFSKNKNILDYNMERIKKFQDEKYKNVVLSKINNNDDYILKSKSSNSSKIENNKDIDSVSDIIKERSIINTTENSLKRENDQSILSKPLKNQKSSINIPPLKFPANINKFEENGNCGPFTQRGGEISKRSIENRQVTEINRSLIREQTWNDKITLNNQMNVNYKMIDTTKPNVLKTMKKNHTQTFSQQNTPRHVLEKFNHDIKNIPNIALERKSTNSADKNRRMNNKSTKSIKNFDPMKYQTKKVIRGKGQNEEVSIDDKPDQKLLSFNDGIQDHSIIEIIEKKTEDLKEEKIKFEESSNLDVNNSFIKIPQTRAQIKETNQSLTHINLPSTSNTPKDTSENYYINNNTKEINYKIKEENIEISDSMSNKDRESINSTKKQLGLEETSANIIVNFLDFNTLVKISNKNLITKKLSTMYDKQDIIEKIKSYESRISKINDKTQNIQSLADEKLTLNRGATKAMELLNNENHYKIFEDKTIVPPIDNLLVFRIYFIVIGKEDKVFSDNFKLIDNKNFWNLACEYFMGFKGSLGFKLISDVSKVSLDESMLFKLEQMINGKFNNSSTAIYNKSCPTTGIFYFFIKEILEFYGILCERRYNAFNALKFANYCLQHYSKILNLIEQ